MPKISKQGDSDLLAGQHHIESANLEIDANLSRLSEARRLIRSVWERAAGHAEACFADEKQVQNMELAATELLSNIIRYAFPESADCDTPGIKETQRASREISVAALVDNEGQLIVHITHNGLPFASDLSMTEPLEAPQEGGMGLFLISRCVDQIIDLCPIPGQNQISLIIYPVSKKARKT